MAESRSLVTRHVQEFVTRGDQKLLQVGRALAQADAARERQQRKLAASYQAAATAADQATSKVVAATRRAAAATEQRARAVTTSTAALGRESHASLQAVVAAHRAAEADLKAAKASLEAANAARTQQRALEAARRQLGAYEAAQRRSTQAARQQTAAYRSAGRGAGLVARARQTAMPILSLGGMISGASTVRQTLEFDRALRNVNSIAQLSERHLQQVGKRLRELAAQTGQAPKTLADGMYELVQADFSAAESLDILRAAANAATAGVTTTEVAVAGVSAVLNAYKRPAKDAQHISDVLFRTVDRGVITFEELSTTIGDVLPFAATLGVDISQVGAAISTMTKQGIGAPETMTRIKAAMQAFIKPSEEMQQAVRELGAESAAALVREEGFQAAIEQVISTTDRSEQSIAKLFPNVRALGAVLALTGDNADGARADLAKFADVAGATDRALAQQSQSVAYQWDRLRAQASSILIDLGNQLVPKAQKLAREAVTFGREFADGIGTGGEVRRHVEAVAAAVSHAAGEMRPFVDVGADIARFIAGLPPDVHAAAIEFGRSGGRYGATQGVHALAAAF